MMQSKPRGTRLAARTVRPVTVLITVLLSVMGLTGCVPLDGDEGRNGTMKDNLDVANCIQQRLGGKIEFRGIPDIMWTDPATGRWLGVDFYGEDKIIGNADLARRVKDCL
jgi:hypothetical protein